MSTETIRPADAGSYRDPRPAGILAELKSAAPTLAYLIVFSIAWGLVLYQIWHFLCVVARPV